MTNLQAYTVHEDTKILQALKKIDANKQGFVIVVDDADDNENFVLGVLTDGDVRRGLISGKSTTDKVKDFYTRKATLVKLVSENGENAGLELILLRSLKI